MYVAYCVLCQQLRKDFEDDKQRAVSRAVAQAQRDIEAARKQAEEKCKEDFTEEMKKVMQKHKAEVSATKKKQWVSNVT
jgi:HSP90 family molecular chaperone